MIVKKDLKVEYNDSSIELVKWVALTVPIYLASGMTYMFDSLMYRDKYDEHLGKYIAYKGLLFGAVDKDTGLFIFIYFVTTIILLRILRLEANNKNQNTLKKINIISSASIVGLLIISFIIDKIAGNKVAEFLRKLMGWHGILDFINIPGGRKSENIIMILFKEHTKHKKGLASKTTHGNFRMNIIIIIAKIIVIALILLCIYILIRTAVRMILRKSASRMSRDGEECVEHIEKIKKKGKSKKGFIKSIADILKNKSNNERIKIYYKLYIKYCDKNDIDITRSDTSLDIQNKSQGLLDKNIVRKLREIYIKVKYSNFSADSNTCNEVKKMVDTMNIDINNIKHKRKS